MDLKKYLTRIDYRGNLQPTLQVLSDLQLAHLLHIPFENLDIHNKIKLDLDKSFEKVVVQNRGGFCYELNSIFFQLLKAIGFNVKMVSARVYSDKKIYGAEFDHMAIITEINEAEYLVDVGFGEFAFHPLKIELNKEQDDPRGKFMITAGDENYLVVMKKNAEGEFIPEYKFSMIERKLEDYFEMCEYHQTSPLSHFTQKRICSLATREGRITVSDFNFKITTNGQIEEKILQDEEQVTAVLKKYFNIVLNPTEPAQRLYV